MPITVDQIDLWRSLPSESRTIEFKEAKTQFDFKKLCRYCVAIANENGGNLILGVEDIPPRIVCGTRAIGNPIDMEQQLLRALGFRVDIAEVAHPDGRVVVLDIPKRPRGVALHFEGSYLMRSGEALVPMTYDRLKAIVREGEPDWLLEPSTDRLGPGKILDLLDTKTLAELQHTPYPTSTAATIENLVSEGFIYDEGGNSFTIRRIGALLLAKELAHFPDVCRKAPRVVVYRGNSKTETSAMDKTAVYGYAVGFQRLVRFVSSYLPQNEVIQDAIRKEVKLIPEIAVRELIANALVHQDFSLHGGATMVEIYENRIEVSNPGAPIVPVERFIDGYRSRNERLTDIMRRMGVCEERSSGIDKVVRLAEQYQLAAPEFIAGENRTIVVVQGPRSFDRMNREERVRACYQHCVLKYVMRDRMTNQSLRERFHLPQGKTSVISQVLSAAMAAGQIKPDEQAGRLVRYLPAWA